MRVLRGFQPCLDWQASLNGYKWSGSQIQQLSSRHGACYIPSDLPALFSRLETPREIAVTKASIPNAHEHDAESQGLGMYEDIEDLGQAHECKWPNGSYDPCPWPRMQCPMRRRLNASTSTQSTSSSLHLSWPESQPLHPRSPCRSWRLLRVRCRASWQAVLGLSWPPYLPLRGSSRRCHRSGIQQHSDGLQ